MDVRSRAKRPTGMKRARVPRAPLTWRPFLAAWAMRWPSASPSSACPEVRKGRQR